MAIRDLFKGDTATSKAAPTKAETIDSIFGAEQGSSVESAENVAEKIKQKDRFVPDVDFSTASNFARFGSAEEYYRSSIKRVYQQYPYDGSEAEKNKFRNQSTFLDLYVLDKLYPSSTGYAVFAPAGWGDQGSTVGGWGSPSSNEFIAIKGGPHTSSGGLIGEDLYKAFDEPINRTSPNSNTYDESIYDSAGVLGGDRVGSNESNLKFDLSKGVSTEFWLKKGDWITSLTEKEVIFDLWNGKASSSADYGRLLVFVSGTGVETLGANPFRVHLASGSEYWDMSFGGSTHTTSSLSNAWKHVAFTFLSSSEDSELQAKFYIDGDLQSTTGTTHIVNFGEITGSLIGYLGALQTTPSGNLYHGKSMTGDGKLSGSIDEFRYWKSKRTSENIGQNWFTQVGGGTNEDVANAELGVYFKFNEGIVGATTSDSVVLDYSGRISNGDWTGYSSASRNTGSAIVSASAAVEEFEDPIIYSTHSGVDSLLTRMVASGAAWDNQNNSRFAYNLPSYLLEEDEESSKDILYLTQIMSSYLDDLHLQIDQLSNISHNNYFSSGSRGLPFVDKLLTSKGFIAPDMFGDAEVLNIIGNRDEDRNFELELYEVKNKIYQNVYNNLSYILKSKGTEKSFRNLIRCFGVDEDLIKINLYSDNGTSTLRNNYRLKSTKKRYVNFNTPTHNTASVYQQSSSADSNTTDVTYISGSDELQYLANTTEIEVIFPKQFPTDHNAYVGTSFQSSSIFGHHTASNQPNAFEWPPSAVDFNFELYAIRPITDDSDAYFVIKDRAGNFTLSSSLYNNVYEDERWNFAVRVKNDKFPVGGLVTGSSGSASGHNVVTLEFYGVNVVSDIVKNEFLLTASSLDKRYLTGHRRYYVGANRTNFSGAVVHNSDVKVSSLRHWGSYLEDSDIREHAINAESYGAPNPYKSSYQLQGVLSSSNVPQIDTLALNWDYSEVTSSNVIGEFTVEDFSSGSIIAGRRYPGTFGEIVGNLYAGRGIGFVPSSTSSVSTEYISNAKHQLPESISGEDMISVLQQDDVTFGKDNRPVDYYITFEKSLYQTISEEMMNMFGSIVEFNNLIGNPVNRYRQDYKELGKLRQLFFEQVQNTPDVDKFISYYIWLDSAMSQMIQQLIPLSANASGEILNVIESHVLERNKYRSKFPMLENKESTEVSIRGHHEMNYSWKHGHAPIPQQATATVTVADGDADSGMTEKESMTITSTDGTSRIYVIIDDNATAVATGAALTTTSDTGANQAGIKATATWTFTDKPNEATTITLIDYEGTSLVFEVDNDGDGGAGSNIEMDPASNNAAGMSAILISKVNASALKITATAGDATGEVLLTQDNAGTAGNKTIALSNYANWNANTAATFPTAFTAGAEVAANSVAVAINTTGTAATQNEFLVQLKAAIESAAGHAGKITVSAVPTEANGAQTITLTQVVGGTSGNAATFSDDISQTTIVGFTGGHDKENENSLWWKERAEVTHLALSQSRPFVNDRREELREVIISKISGTAPTFKHNPAYSSSLYNVRTMPGLYSISGDMQKLYTSGDNSNQDDKKYYYRELIEFSKATGLIIEDIEDEVYITDDISMPKSLQKIRKRFRAGGEFKQNVAPFTIMSSSTPSRGYNTNLYSNFKSNVDITNNHTDTTFGNEISMQSPFTEKFVGGSFHRHADLNQSASAKTLTGHAGGLDSTVERIEAYDMTLASDKITIAHRDINKPRSSYFREEVAKRPVNIRNIKLTTGSGPNPAVTQYVSGTLQSTLGNFSNIHEVVQTSDRSTNNSSYVKAGGFDSSSAISYLLSDGADFEKPSRRRTGHVFVERFSAPGGPETSGDNLGGPALDFESAQFSPYNDMNTRNSTVRAALKTLLQERAEQFGIRSGSSVRGVDYDTLPSYHDVNRNALSRRRNTSEVDPEKATATITVADGDAASGMAEKETIVITSTDGTAKTYCVIDDNATTVATGAVLAADSDIGSEAAGAALVGAIAVAINLTGSASTQNTFLVQLKAAIESANGHAGKITVSSVPTEANGAQAITLTQAVGGSDGNVTITDDISQTTIAGFTGGINQSIVNEVVATFDNYYVQHEIPRSDLQYSWITSSYLSTHVFGHAPADGEISSSAITSLGRAFGVVPAITFASASSISTASFIVDFVGLNTLIHEPFTSSTGRRGYPASQPLNSYRNTALHFPPTGGLRIGSHSPVATDGNEVLNALLLHRNGPYSYPSWKQLRNDENPIVRHWRRNSTIAINPDGEETNITVVASSAAGDGYTIVTKDKYGGLRTFIEPAVMSRNLPLTINLGIKNGTSDVATSLKSSFSNDLDYFGNASLNNALTLPETQATSYDSIKSLYLEGGLANAASPVNTFIDLTYAQNVWPKPENAFQNKTRKRNNYENNFWRKVRTDRDSLGDRKYVSNGALSGAYSAWAMDADNDFSTDITGTTAGILQNNTTHMFQKNVNGSTTAASATEITASILFHRKHGLASTGSVRKLAGLQVVETGSTNLATATEPLGDIQIGGGNAVWEVDSGAGFYSDDGTFNLSPSSPWYDDYSEFSDDLRTSNKDMSIIPEFRISEHIKKYMNVHNGNFLADNESSLSIFGAPSGSSLPQNSSETDFYNVYTNSDFMKHFATIRKDHEGFADASEITLTCEALTKFVPYDGFYPSELLVDLYNTFSSSYGNFVQYDGATSNLAAGLNAKIRPFIAPMFAPGIWCNTIKSGIAVDYPVYTGSYVVHSPLLSPSGKTTYKLLSTSSLQSLDGFDLRVPFDALVQPEKYLTNMTLVDMEASFSSSVNITASWTGEGSMLYKMRAHNALSSMIEFFLQGEGNKGDLTTIKSLPEDQFQPFVSGTTYAMRVKLRKSYNKPRQENATFSRGFTLPQDTAGDVNAGLEETITICSRPSSFGPPVAGRKNISFASGTAKASYPQTLDSLTGINPAFTPPYYDGECWCDITYTHATSTQPTLKDIQRDANLTHFRFDPVVWNGGSNYQPYGKANINHYAMQLTSSVDVLGRISEKSVEYDALGNPITVKDDETQTSDVWVIQPKFETPILNIQGAPMTIPTNGSASATRSIWSQFGRIPTGSEGIFLEVVDINESWLNNRADKFENQDSGFADSDSFGARDFSNLYTLYGSGSKVESLSDMVGFQSPSKNLGQLADLRTVKEAIVAIPFLEIDGKRSFFDVPKEQIDAAVSMAAGGETTTTAGDSIVDMVNKMQNYVIPPKFDFIKNSDFVDPFAMYIFEFSYTFDRDDLSYIWQNMQPRSSKLVEKSTASINHRLLAHELMGEAAKNTGKPLQDELRWMVFKVKQKSATNYFDKIVQYASSDDKFDFDFNVGTAAASAAGLPDYSFNWPYDNFSIVELAKLNTEVKFTSVDPAEDGAIQTSANALNSGISEEGD
mgnify:CR=1 FL=1